LKRLIKGWKGNAPSQIGSEEKPVEQYSVIELTALEQAVARFYTQSFFNFFGRAAIVPHWLQVPSSGEALTLPHQFLVESSEFLRIPRNPRNEPGMNQNWRICNFH
jgi:hypothetical protein